MLMACSEWKRAAASPWLWMCRTSALAMKRERQVYGHIHMFGYLSSFAVLASSSFSRLFFFCSLFTLLSVSLFFRFPPRSAYQHGPYLRRGAFSCPLPSLCSLVYGRTALIISRRVWLMFYGAHHSAETDI